MFVAGSMGAAIVWLLRGEAGAVPTGCAPVGGRHAGHTPARGTRRDIVAVAADDAIDRLQADYSGTGLTIGPHPMSLHRTTLALRGVLRAIDPGAGA